MLKRYYGLTEAAEFLSSEHKQQIQPSDVMEMAARGEIRLYIWGEGTLAIFEDSGDRVRFVRPIGGFRGYILIPSHVISPFAQRCQFWQVFLADDIRGERGIEIPFVIHPDYVGIVEYRGDPDDMGVVDLLEYTAFGPFKPRAFTPTIDEMVIHAADLLALGDDSANKHQAYQGLKALEKKGDCDTYSTPHVAILNAAIAEFFNPRRQVDPKKPDVVSWISEKIEDAGLPPSNNLAEAIFTIIKPTDHDPRKRRG